MGVLQLNVEKTDRILIIAPHPDDESIGVGGLLLSYPKQCDVIVMTDGRYGSKGVSPEKISIIRNKEFHQAMDMARVNSYKMFENADGMLMQNKDCFRNVEFALYTMVFLPNPNDNHTDHTAAFEYALQEIKKQGVKGVKVFQYEVHTPLNDINTYLDISNIIQKKQTLVACHASQMKIHQYDKQINVLAQYRGLQNEMEGKYLETYREVSIEIEESEKIKIERELAKYTQFTRILSKWITLREHSDAISSYLIRNGYKTVAIYGFGQIGKMLYDELKDSKCRVKYVIDRNGNVRADGISVCTLDKQLEEVDVVVVTAVFYYQEIAIELLKKHSLQSISLEKILMDI